MKLYYIICSSLAPGAHNLLASLNNNVPGENHINVKSKVNELNIHNWATLVKAFSEWPFAPDVRLVQTLAYSVLISFVFPPEFTYIRKCQNEKGMSSLFKFALIVKKVDGQNSYGYYSTMRNWRSR